MTRPRHWQRPLAALLLTCFIVLPMLSGCARHDINDLANRQPALDLFQFFEGESVAYGIFEDRYGQLRRQFRVNLNGIVEDNTLVLDEQFRYDDGERASRTWVIERLPDREDGNAYYAGSAADVNGQALGQVTGNALNWRYDVSLNISGRDVDVHFNDWIYRQDEDVAINRAYVSKFGIEIGSVTLVFLRGKAAAAIGPLDLSRWPR